MFTLTTLIAVAAGGTIAALVPLPFGWRLAAGVLALLVALALIAVVKAILGLVLLILLIAAIAFIASKLGGGNERAAKSWRGKREL